MLRIGIAGYGYWGPNLLRNFASSDHFNLVAVAERLPEIRKKLAQSFPHLKILEDASELANSPDVDAVAIATPAATHYELTREALLHGKHVLVEKPMCMSAAEGEELISVADRVGRVLMVNHTFLFTGAVQTIHKLVKTGELGDVCYFDSMRVNLGLFRPDTNCLWDLAPHDLSIIDYIMRDEVIAVDATGYCHVNVMYPDMVYMTLHYANDLVAHFNLSWMSPVKVRRFTIGGTKQMLIWDDLDQDQKVRVYNSGIKIRPESERETTIPDYRIGDIYSPRISRHEALAAVVEHFARVILGAERSIMGGEEGLRIVRILEAAQRKLDHSLADIARRRNVPVGLVLRKLDHSADIERRRNVPAKLLARG